MPTVNLYYHKQELEPHINEAIEPLQEHIAEQLTCGDISLAPHEVSIRGIHVALARGMIADIEMDMTAAPFPERVERQDEICLDVQAFAKEHIPQANEIKVWLNLHELGHSFK